MVATTEQNSDLSINDRCGNLSAGFVFKLTDALVVVNTTSGQVLFSAGSLVCIQLIRETLPVDREINIDCRMAPFLMDTFDEYEVLIKTLKKLYRLNNMNKRKHIVWLTTDIYMVNNNRFACKEEAFSSSLPSYRFYIADLIDVRSDSSKSVTESSRTTTTTTTTSVDTSSSSPVDTTTVKTTVTASVGENIRKNTSTIADTAPGQIIVFDDDEEEEEEEETQTINSNDNDNTSESYVQIVTPIYIEGVRYSDNKSDIVWNTTKIGIVSVFGVVVICFTSISAILLYRTFRAYALVPNRVV